MFVSTLYENTSREKTVYLGPWEVIGSHNRRVVWQCTYRNERLEHFGTLNQKSKTFRVNPSYCSSTARRTTPFFHPSPEHELT